MKIVHVYAKNMQMFVDAVKDTDIRLNASQDIDYLLNSLQNFNARDVLGLVIFANPVTKKCLKLVKKFDTFFSFKQMPIIIIGDNSTEMWDMGYFRVKNSKVFLIDSEEDSISDIDVNAIFTTLLAFSDTLYDLSVCNLETKHKAAISTGEEKEMKMSDQLANLLQSIKESETDAYSGEQSAGSEEVGEETAPWLQGLD